MKTLLKVLNHFDKTITQYLTIAIFKRKLLLNDLTGEQKKQKWWQTSIIQSPFHSSLQDNPITTNSFSLKIQYNYIALYNTIWINIYIILKHCGAGSIKTCKTTTLKCHQSFEHSNASLTSSAASMLVPQLIEIPLAPWP